MTADFIVNCMEKQEFKPTITSYARHLIVADQIRNLFSASAFETFKKVEVGIGPNLGPTGQGAIHTFIEARAAALVIFYREAGISAVANPVGLTARAPLP